MAFSNNRFFKLFSTNDYSYGIYIFAFPIQQTIVTLFHGEMTWWQNALSAYPIVLCVAALSWHFVERPSLRYGRNLDKKVIQNPTVRLGASKGLP
jgi:peptidoglycan/LPS O-acetylase OafA/YrhL